MKTLALIPARGGSKGLPGKNTRLFAGLPLIAHSILMARMCPSIDQIIVSTDDPEIVMIAKEYGAEVPFIRPVEIAQDETPMWPVIRHAVQWMKVEEKCQYDYCLLLDPTSPGRFPEDIQKALKKLEETPEAAGIIGVSQPEFNPIWHCVTEQEGWMKNLISAGSSYGRRQNVPPVYRINASLYIWRTSFVFQTHENWRDAGKHLLYEIPEKRAIHIDDLEEFERAELMIKAGLISFPWLN